MRRLRGLGFGVIVVALTVGVIAGVVTAVQHIPRPATKVEWVQRADAIIVQRQSVFPCCTEVIRRGVYPDFTLYGDGTLIYSHEGQLYEAHLPDSALRNVLQYIADEGFFVFSYEQPHPQNLADQSTTYIYAQTKLDANAVAVLGLKTQPSNRSGEWEQFRRMQRINDRIDAIDPDALSEDRPALYRPAALVLLVQPVETPAATAVANPWSYSQIDLSAIAPPGSGAVQRRLEGAATEGLPFMCGLTFETAQRYFEVCVRPGFPYEENFPEFDTTQ